MLISILVILGFRREIHALVYAETGQLSISSYASTEQGADAAFRFDSLFRSTLYSVDGVEQVIPAIQTMALVKTPELFDGISLTGLDEKDIPDFYRRHLLEGALDLKPDSLSGAPSILLSREEASRMGYRLGDKVQVYFAGSKIKLRSFLLKGILDVRSSRLPVALCSREALARVFKYTPTEVNRLMIFVRDPDRVEQYRDKIISSIEADSEHLLPRGASLGINTARELYPSLFGWLELIDGNVYFLLAIMLLVGGFSMIIGLITLVLDKRKEIGILKSLGCSNREIQKIFMLLAFKITLYGILWGNVVALGFGACQHWFSPIKLNPETYYMSSVPIAFDGTLYLAVNVGTVLLIMLMILYPTKIIRRVSPAESMCLD